MKYQRIVDSHGEDIIINKPLEYYLPRILSVRPFGKTLYTIIEGHNNPVKERMLTAEKIKTRIDNLDIKSAIDEVKKIMPLINPRRSDRYESWSKIGWALYNSTAGSKEGLDIFLQFSQLTSDGNYCEEDCIDFWNKIQPSTMTIGTLKSIAREDNPEGYIAYDLANKRKKVQDNLDGNTTHFAKQLFDAVGDKYVLANPKEKLWYVFKKHRWEEDPEGLDLWNCIESDLVTKYIEEIGRLAKEMNDMENDDLNQIRNSHGEKIKKLNSIVHNLRMSGFKSSIIKDCYSLFYKKDFLKKLDRNPYLLGFNNGILDLKTCLFRDGLPDDYVSLSCGYDYKEFTPDDPEVQEIEAFYTKLFTEEDMRQYFLEWAGSLLRGGNREKTFMIFSGERGDNGKSAAIELLEKTLGSYNVKFPTTIITGERSQSSAATPELDRAPNARLASVQEPGGNDTVKVGKLKELTGNDSLYIRGMYKGGRDEIPLFKMVMICNNVPKLDKNEVAVWNRIKRVVFESRFPANNLEVPIDIDDQFKEKTFYRDPFLNEKFIHWRAPMMWVMVQHYKKVAKRGKMKEPEKVRMATEIYKKENDLFLQFIIDCVKEDKHSEVLLSSLYDSYKDWYITSYGNNRVVPRTEFKNEIEKKWGTIKLNKWIGYRLRTINDDVEEGKVITLSQNDLTDHELSTDDEL